MRILVDNSGYALSNHGDVAMLQVAVSRLRTLWPNARIDVMTRVPHRLAAYCPEAHAVFPSLLQSQMLTRLPRALSRRWLQLDRVVPRWLWSSRKPAVQPRALWRKGVAEDDGGFVEALLDADVVIASGGGYLTDTFRWQATHVLSVLGMAIQLGKSTAMFGQGLGPLRSRRLRTRMSTVLPALQLIALREERAGPALLDSLHVAPERVIITGDDAIEPAHAGRASALGAALGLSLRVPGYSGVDLAQTDSLRTALRHAAARCSAPLLPVSIDRHDLDSDRRAIRQLVPDVDLTGEVDDDLDTPQKLIAQVARCRVVVTGSYHGAVFALAQGIPAICLVNSAYYVEKALGLAQQFRLGCDVISLDDPQLQRTLAHAIDRAWASAERLRPGLLQSAVEQISMSHAAYRRLHAIVEAKREQALGESLA